MASDCLQFPDKYEGGDLKLHLGGEPIPKDQGKV